MNSFEEIKKTVDDFVVSLGRRSSYSLERVEKLLEKLDNPQEKFKTVHIAGTSGKTSTAYYTASMLEAAGYKTGLSVSPYLEELNERIQIGTRPVPEEIFCKEFTEFFEKVKSLDIRPTYFELFVSFSYWYFAKSKMDYAVVEVGLGGLLDATNVIKRPDKICIITDIGLDHIRILGDTLGEIASQKAGIIQDHNPVFMYRQGDEVDQSILERARSKHATIHYVETSDLLPDLPKFQKRNWNLAKNVCDYILIRDGHNAIDEKVRLKTADIVVPGRLELLESQGKKVVLDGAHNPQKMGALIDSFKARFPHSSVSVLLAIGDNKNAHLKDITAEVDKLHGSVIVTTFKKDGDDSKLSIDADEIAKGFKISKVETEPDLDNALKRLFERDDDLLLITGSLYLVGIVRKRLRKRP